MKAEFINGDVILHSPAKRNHWKVTDLLSRLISTYAEVRSLGIVGTEKVMIALSRNDYEPDLVFYGKEKADKFESNQMLFPAPDFIVEILSKSTYKKDKGVKKEDFAAHGISEYWIIDPENEIVEQYLLGDISQTEYQTPIIHKVGDDIESIIILGFSIPVKAIFDSVVNIETLRKII